MKFLFDEVLVHLLNVLVNFLLFHFGDELIYNPFQFQTLFEVLLLGAWCHQSDLDALEYVVLQQVDDDENYFYDHHDCEIGWKYPDYVVLDIEVIGQPHQQQADNHVDGQPIDSKLDLIISKLFPDFDLLWLGLLVQSLRSPWKIVDSAKSINEEQINIGWYEEEVADDRCDDLEVGPKAHGSKNDHNMSAHNHYQQVDEGLLCENPIQPTDVHKVRLIVQNCLKEIHEDQNSCENTENAKPCWQCIERSFCFGVLLMDCHWPVNQDTYGAYVKEVKHFRKAIYDGPDGKKISKHFGIYQLCLSYRVWSHEIVFDGRLWKL